MNILDIEFKFELKKRKILARIEEVKEEWRAIWERCVGDPQAEAIAVQAKLYIQLVETEAFEVIKEMEQEVNILREKINPARNDEPPTRSSSPKDVL